MYAITDAEGRTCAEVIGQRGAAPATDAGGEWIAVDGAALEREGLRTTFSAPWTDTRIVCRSQEARAFLGRCLGGAAPENEIERALARAGAGGGLLERSREGLPSEAHASGGGAPAWRGADARFWASFATDREGDPPKGATRPHPREEAIPARVETTIAEDRGSIALEGADGCDRPIPASAKSFSQDPIPLDVLGRWIARFMRVRSRSEITKNGKSEDRIRRGFPEAGALGALGLWIASRRLEDVPEGLWRYDADRHRLVGGWGATGKLALDAARAHAEEGGHAAAGVGIVTAQMERANAQYDRIALSLALQNAGVCMAAAARGGEAEGITIRIYGRIDASEFARQSGTTPRREAAIGAFGFGMIDAEV